MRFTRSQFQFVKLMAIALRELMPDCTINISMYREAVEVGAFVRPRHLATESFLVDDIHNVDIDAAARRIHGSIVSQVGRL